MQVATDDDFSHYVIMLLHEKCITLWSHWSNLQYNQSWQCYNIIIISNNVFYGVLSTE